VTAYKPPIGRWLSGVVRIISQSPRGADIMSESAPRVSRIPTLTCRVSWQEQADQILLLGSLVAFLIGILLIMANHYRSGFAGLSVCDGLTYWRWGRAWRGRRGRREAARCDKRYGAEAGATQSI
jgi:hypothetical protein